MPAPRFSIVLPTRNRRDLVRQVLTNLLAQTYADFEIVVCDNASDDDTGAVVAGFEDERVRYFRTDTWIPKEHFFQWGLQFARGEYFCWFFDDDAMCRRGLEKIAKVLDTHPTDVVTYGRNCVYFLPDYPVAERADTLTIPNFTRTAEVHDSAEHLKLIYDAIEIYLPTPMVSNAFFRLDFMQALVGRYGQLFPHGHMGDYNIACFVLKHTPHFVFLNDPIAVFGHWASNTSAQLHDLATTMPEYQEWIDWISRELLSVMPWPQYLWPNCIAAALIDLAEKLDLPLRPNGTTYYRTLFRELNRLTRECGNAAELSRSLVDHVLAKGGLPALTAAADLRQLQPAHCYVEGWRTLETYVDDIFGWPDANQFEHLMPRSTLLAKGGTNFGDVAGACAFLEMVTGEDAFLQWRAESAGRNATQPVGQEPAASGPIAAFSGSTSVVRGAAGGKLRFNIVYGNHGSGENIQDLLMFLKLAAESAGHRADLGRAPVRGCCNVLIECFEDPPFVQQVMAMRDETTRFVVVGTEYITGTTFNDMCLEDGSHYGNAGLWRRRYANFLYVSQICDAGWVVASDQVGNYKAATMLERVLHLPFGFVEGHHPASHRPEGEKDIDFLFTGNLTEYRRDILSALAGRSNVQFLKAMTPEYVRRDHVGRARICLNLRQSRQWRYASPLRMHYHLVNSSPLISETCATPCDLDPYVEFGPSDKDAFVEHCLASLAQGRFAERAGERLQRYREEMNMKDIMPGLIEASLS